MAAGNKETQLKKRLIKEAVTEIVLAIILVAGAWELSHYDDDALAEKETRTREISSIQSDADSLQSRLNSGTEAVMWYNLYTQNHNAGFVLNREAATGWLADLREKHHLANLSVTISPITDVTGEVFQLKTGKLVKSDVILKFGTISDSAAYNFIEDLQRQFPGIVLVYEIKIDQTPDFPKDPDSGSAIKALAQKLSYNLDNHVINPMVDVQISFLWLGIRPDEKPGQSTGGSGIVR